MKCKDCKFWQGNKHSEWADCYRVIGQLNEYITSCYMSDDHGAITAFFKLPFDPHDIKYWQHNEIWYRLFCNAVVQADQTDGVRTVVQTRDDVKFDQKGGEAIGRLKCYYFQTHKDYDCKEEEIEE
jgi:hypothetical protein